MPAWLLPAVSAFGSLIGGLFDNNSQQTTNEQNQQFAREMYERQRADNLSMWHTQNDYNSPQKQMQRLRESGLNPNLVYGNGSAVNTASPVANATPNVPQRVAPRIGAAISGATDSLAMFYDLQAKQASIDNMRVQNTVLKNEALLKSIRAEDDTFDLELKKELRENTKNLAIWTLQDRIDSSKLKQTIQFGKSIDNWTNQQTQTARISAANLSPTVIQAQLQNLYSGTKLRQAELELKKLEADLRKNGITSSDPIYFRVLGRLAQKFGLTIQP